MDIDERIGQMIINLDENFLPFAEKIRNLLKKANCKPKNDEYKEKKD